ncbi:MAG: CPBP family intramembrane glutamic endopeptidase [Anaerolineales bacterium]
MSAVIKFFLITFGFSWLFWLPAVVAGKDVTASWWGVAWLMGGFGPSLVGLLLAARSEGRRELRDLWQRTIQPRRLTAGWVAFILLVIPVISAASAGAAALFGWQQASFQGLQLVLANPALLIGMVFGGLIAGPISEELGWRGYALEKLQLDYSPARSTWLLAFVWWTWHIPLFFMEGTTQAGWGFFSMDSLFFFITIFPLSFIFTWVYNSTGRSVLGAILLHFGFNFTLGLVLPASADFDIVRIVLMTLVAWGMARFTSPPADAPVPGLG